MTEPIRTRQGFVILKVQEHVAGGPPEYKEVQQQVEEALYMARTEPAMRGYLTKMREDAFIDIKPGYTDTGASVKQTKPVFSAYVPPAPKKKKKVERTRYREATHTFRQKTRAAVPEASAAPVPAAGTKADKKALKAERASQKAGKKEKIRFGQAPTKTLPNAANAPTEDGGAAPAVAASQAPVSAPAEPANPLESGAKPDHKTRFSARVQQPKAPKMSKDAKADSQAPTAPDAGEVADRTIQAAPLGLNGSTAQKPKTQVTTTGEKQRLSKKKKEKKQPEGDQPLAAAPAQK